MEQVFNISLSPNYVTNWGLSEAIREILQNAIDGNDMSITYDEDTLIISNNDTKIDASSLVLGNSSKTDGKHIGKFGEGYKLALIVLLREGYRVFINNADEVWTPYFEHDEQFNTDILKIRVEDAPEPSNSLEFIIMGIDGDKLEYLTDTHIVMQKELYDECYEHTVSELGEIITDPEYKGNMYVDGLFVNYDSSFLYGYNFKSEYVELDRDRKAINYWELRRLTKNALTSQTENMEIVKKALMNSQKYGDARELSNAQDSFSGAFIEEYKTYLMESIADSNDIDNAKDVVFTHKDEIKNLVESTEDNIQVVKVDKISASFLNMDATRLDVVTSAEVELKSRDKEQRAKDSYFSSGFCSLLVWLSESTIKFKDASHHQELMDILEELSTDNFDLIKEELDEFKLLKAEGDYV